MLFVGFNGEGEAALNVSAAQLGPWFQQLRAVLPHTVAPEPHASPTTLQYATRLHVHRLGPEVTARVEQLLDGHLRPESVGDPRAAHSGRYQQMSAPLMSALLASLSRSLRLPGYSVFVLNPRRRVGVHTYGYRSGFSKDEVRHMRGSDEFRRMMGEAARVVDGLHSKHAPKLSESFLRHPADSSKAKGKSGKSRQAAAKRGAVEHADEETIRQRGVAWASGEASDLLGGWLESEGGTIGTRGEEEALLARVGATVAHTSSTQQQQVHEQDHKDASAALASDWHSGNLLAVEEAMRGGDSSVCCLTDMWVSSLPIAFIDLTAGPFEWGPIGGGDGARTLSSLPDLHHRARFDLPTAADGGADGSDDDGSIAAELESLQAERQLMHELMQQACARAAMVDPSKNEHSEDLHDDEAHYYDEEMHKEATDEHAECEAMRARLNDFERYLNELEVHQKESSGDKGKGKAKDKKAPAAAGAAGPLIGKEKSALTPPGSTKLDGMLSQIGLAVSQLKEHVLLPPVLPLTLTSSSEQPYAERVAFHIYVVSAHASYELDGPDGLALSAFERGLLTLRLPSQHFTFTTTHLQLYKDAGLATAYAASLHHSIHPIVKSDGSVQQTETVYLDSRELSAALRRTAPPPPPPASLAATQTSRTIPIFLFSTDSELPIFIDRDGFEVARAIDGMVLVVQSDHTKWDAPMTCSGDHRITNLKRPIRSALTATAQVLGGLAPPHIGRRSHSWLWSVGDSPLSLTSSGLDFGAHYASILHRHYIVAGLEASTARLARTNDKLATIRTTREVYAALHADTRGGRCRSCV